MPSFCSFSTTSARSSGDIFAWTGGSLFLAGSGGLIAGALVGMVEASYLLSSGAPEEYVALFYAVVLYGAIGVGGC